MFKKLHKLLFFITLLPAKIYAAEPQGIIPDSSKGTPMPNNAGEIYVWVERIQTLVFGLAGLIAVIMIIWGGFTLMTAGGNEERAGKGKKVLTYSIGGLILVLMSYAIVRFLVILLGGDIGGGA